MPFYFRKECPLNSGYLMTPPLFDLPWYENVSEIFGHLVWFWSIEIIRRDLRNRITHEPDPEIPLGSNR
nr:DUF1440 domain-containing protein [Escherichia coli]